MLKDDSIDPSNNKDIQSSILRNTIDSEDPANKKCVDENT